MNGFEVTIQRYGPEDFAVSAPTLEGRSHFESEKQAEALAKHLIGARSGGGSITRIDENGETNPQLHQGSRPLSQTYSSQR